MVEKGKLSRRDVLKKGAATTAVLAGGTVAASGSAAAYSYASVRLTTDSQPGSFSIEIDADREPEVGGDPYYLRKVEPQSPDDNWVIEGYIAGEPNNFDNPDRWAAIYIYEFNEFVSVDPDPNVDVDIDKY